MFKGRTTVEIVVLMFTITACLALLLIGAGVAAVQIFDVDTTGPVTPAVDFLQTSLGLIIGALLGLLAKGTTAPTDPGGSIPPVTPSTTPERNAP